MPPSRRAATNSADVVAAPAPSADSRNSTAEAISTERRPRRSARRPARNAPRAQPSSIEATSKPTPAELEWKARRRPSTVPLMTPLSKPKRKPPIAATPLIRTMKRVFSACPLPARSRTALFIGCSREFARSSQQVLVQQVFVALLLAAQDRRLSVPRRQRAQVGQTQLALFEVAAGAAVETSIAFPSPGFQRRAGEQRMRDLQPAGEGVHAADVAEEQVLGVGGLAPHLGVEVEPARRQPA